jgi:imidazolonepropionase-like amidohydrolase
MKWLLSFLLPGRFRIWPGSNLRYSMNAIKTATLNTAKLLQIDNKPGQIRSGFLADLIAVKGNPLDNIALLQQTEFVMKEGKIYKRP